MSKFFIQTFYTEGQPHDAGVDLRQVEEEYRQLLTPFADRYVSYCPRTLQPDGHIAERTCADYTQWLENHPLRHQLDNYNPGWAKVGFNSWKPYILRKLLLRDDVELGDVILYHDVDTRKYPQYKDHVDEWKELSRQLLEQLSCDLFVPVGLRLERDVKAFLIRKYLGDAHRHDYGLWDGLIVVRKTPAAMSFVEEWLQMCLDLDNVSPLPDPEPYSGNFWHAIDQAVLSVLARRWCLRGQLPSDWPRFTAQFRRFGFRSMACIELSESLARAKHLQHAGDLETAGQLFRQVLQVEPFNSEAIHFLGVLAFQSGQHDGAIALLEQSLELRADVPYFHSNIALVYQAIGKLDQAVTHNREAVRLDPAFAGGYHNLGVALRHQGASLDEAVACYREAVRLEPGRQDSLRELANLLQDMGRNAEALEVLRQVVTLQPESAEDRGK